MVVGLGGTEALCAETFAAPPAASGSASCGGTGSTLSSGEGTSRATPLTPSGALAALREAIEAGGSVLIGYVDNQGTSSERLVDPVRVEGGSLTAHDHRSDDVRTFAVHRITTVRPVTPDP